MKQLLVILLFFVWGISSSQTTYINDYEHIVRPLLEKIKAEYKDNGITETQFHLLDSVLVMQLDYPDVGYWMRRRGRHKILLHEWLVYRTDTSLEYTLKHELGHMHGLYHNTDSTSMMFSYHNAPSTKEEWLEMNKKYYADLKKLTQTTQKKQHELDN